MAGLTTCLSGKLVGSIGHADIEERKRKRGAVISARSYNIEPEALKMLFRYACECRILLDNITDKFKRKKQPKAVVKIPTHAEFSAIVETRR